MPDITMCLGNGCPMKEQCYRYRAVPNKIQSYMHAPHVGSECSMYWECGEKNIRTMEEIQRELIASAERPAKKHPLRLAIAS